MASASTTLLCAIRFWARSSRVTTLRKGTRKVARAQGHSAADLDRAERTLVKRGLVEKPRKGAVALTEKGMDVSERACKAVALPPWTNDAFGRSKRRRR